MACGCSGGDKMREWDYSKKLQEMGPFRTGLLDQHHFVGWKFLSSRFKKLYGQAYQCSPLPEIIDIMQRRARKYGHAYVRRLDGRNGWLWKTVLDLKVDLSRIEAGDNPRFIVVPSKPTLRERAALWLFRR